MKRNAESSTAKWSVLRIVGAVLLFASVIDLILLELAGTLSSPCVPGTHDSMDFWGVAMFISVVIVIAGVLALVLSWWELRPVFFRVITVLVMTMAVVALPLSALIGMMAVGAHADRSSPPGVCDTGVPQANAAS